MHRKSGKFANYQYIHFFLSLCETTDNNLVREFNSLNENKAQSNNIIHNGRYFHVLCHILPIARQRKTKQNKIINSLKKDAENLNAYRIL